MKHQGVFPPSRSGRYVGKVTQSSTDTPVLVAAQENTLNDTPVLARSGVGVYTLTKTALFTAGKTLVRAHGTGASAAAARVFNTVYTSADVCTIYVYDLGATPAAADSGDFDLEIEIYG
jgi:hypothetical protein